jgi:hypothetical protein
MPRFDLVIHTRSAVEFSRVSYLRLLHSRFRSASLAAGAKHASDFCFSATAQGCATRLASGNHRAVQTLAFIQVFQPEQPLCSVRSFDKSSRKAFSTRYLCKIQFYSVLLRYFLNGVDADQNENSVREIR